MKLYCYCGSFFESESLLLEHLTEHKKIISLSNINNFKKISIFLNEKYNKNEFNLYQKKLKDVISIELFLSNCIYKIDIDLSKENVIEYFEKMIELYTSIENTLSEELYKLSVFKSMEFECIEKNENKINLKMKIYKEDTFFDALFISSNFEDNKLYLENDLFDDVYSFIYKISSNYINEFIGEIISLDYSDELFIKNESSSVLIPLKPFFDRCSEVEIKILGDLND